MFPELGNFSLILALGFACTQGFLLFVVRSLSPDEKLKLGRSLILAQGFFLTFSFFCLVYAFVSNDFSVRYVAENSNRALPLIYRICAVWGAHEGSLLLWILLLSFWSIFFIHRTQKFIPALFKLRCLSILGGVSAGLLLFLILTSNPFLRFLPNVPVEGHDLNPLLQDPGFVLHPPLLYMGYVGFAISFCVALSLLWEKEKRRDGLAWLYPWTIAAWSFLTLGITLGSWWAYRELGWGGFWFWDPVENASLMPWLAGTALLHSLKLSRQDAVYFKWSILLAILTFSLSLLGTFLVRSGVLISVHSFASDPSRGIFMLIFLGLTTGSALFFYMSKLSTFSSSYSVAPPLQHSSKKLFLSVATLFLVVGLITIMLGTLYPLILDGLNLEKISVGAPYFNQVLAPIVAFALIAMSVLLFQLRNRLLNFLSLIISTMAAVFLATRTDQFFYHILVIVIFSLGVWLLLGTLGNLFLEWFRSRRFPRYKLSMSFGHAGVAVLLIGICGVSLLQSERDMRMSVGDSAIVKSYEFFFSGLKEFKENNFEGTQAEFTIHRDKKFIGTLKPEKRFYPARNNIMTEAAILPGFFRDFYIALGEPLTQNQWSVRIYVKPFIEWIWMGGVLIACAGFSALVFNRKKYQS